MREQRPQLSVRLVAGAGELLGPLARAPRGPAAGAAERLARDPECDRRRDPRVAEAVALHVAREPEPEAEGAERAEADEDDAEACEP